MGILARNLGLQFCPRQWTGSSSLILELTIRKTVYEEKGRRPGDKIEGEVYHCIIPGNKRGEKKQR